MSPLFVEILLWHYGRADDYPEWGKGRAQAEIRGQMLADGLLEHDGGSGELVITDKGKCLVEAICALPMPVQAWRMPNA